MLAGLSVCLFVFDMISRKLMQLRSPNVTYTWSTMSPGNRLFWGQKVKGHGHKAPKIVLAWVFALL